MEVHNQGIFSTGSGTINLSGNTAIGQNARVESAARPHTNRGRSSWNIGVITALSVEMHEVVAMLRRIGDVAKRTGPTGQRFHETSMTIDAKHLKIVGTQTVSPGQRSVMAAFQGLRELYSPQWIVLIGVAGGVHADIQIGDVVIAQEVIYYDMRRIAADGEHQRGQNQPAPAMTMHAVNDFFADNGYPLVLVDEQADGKTFRVTAGPIASGEAVITDQNSTIPKRARAYNEKTLAVETEAGGLAQAFFEGVNGDDSALGWLVIRGISDKADAKKGHDFHSAAARHAARTFELLLPHLTIVD